MLKIFLNFNHTLYIYMNINNITSTFFFPHISSIYMWGNNLELKKKTHSAPINYIIFEKKI